MRTIFDTFALRFLILLIFLYEIFSWNHCMNAAYFHNNTKDSNSLLGEFSMCNKNTYFLTMMITSEYQLHNATRGVVIRFFNTYSDLEIVYRLYTCSLR